MAIILIRTIILYAFLMVALRLSGKRQIGQLQPTELVMAILVSELVAVPMQDIGIPLINGLLPLVTLMCIELLVSGASLKSRKIRQWVYGTPSVMIKDGIICKKTLEKHRITLDDLIEELRLKDYFSVSDVDFAIIETNGQLSVLPKIDKTVPTCGDLNIKPKQKGLPCIIIMDGVLYSKALKDSKKDMIWLNDYLSAQQLKIREVLLLTVDRSDAVFCVPCNNIDGTNIIDNKK